MNTKLWLDDRRPRPDMTWDHVETSGDAMFAADIYWDEHETKVKHG